MKLTAKKTTVAIILKEDIGPRKKGSLYVCNMMLASVLIRQKKAELAKTPDISAAKKEFKVITTVD